MRPKNGCPTRLQKKFQGHVKGFSGWQRYKSPKSIAKLNYFIRLNHTEALLLRKKGHKTDIIPVLQKLTHICWPPVSAWWCNIIRMKIGKLTVIVILIAIYWDYWDITCDHVLATKCGVKLWPLSSSACCGSDTTLPHQVVVQRCQPPCVTWNRYL